MKEKLMYFWFLMVGKTRLLLCDESGGDGGTQGISFLGGIIIAVIVIGIIIGAINTFLPGALNAVFDRVNGVLGI